MNTRTHFLSCDTQTKIETSFLMVMNNCIHTLAFFIWVLKLSRVS
jgi:hypothetical protein